MDNELYQKAIQAMSIKEQREMKKALLSAIEAKNLQYQGEKGDSVVDVYQKNGDLYVVIEQLGGKQKTFNIGRVKGDKGDKGDDGLDYVLTQKDVNNIVKLVKSLVKDGKDGERGEDGYTPVKGKDYFTQADKDEIAMSVESQLAPMISEELDAETIADKLETLEGEARLDAKAIKNLPKMVQNINSGVRQLRYLSDVNPSGTTGQVLTLQADGTFALETVSGGSGVSDGDKGDITVSGSGATWTIDDGAVTFAKMQHIATNRILGRSTAGTGDIEALADGDARDIMGLATTDSPQFAGINLGHPTDTTITRVSAGVIAVEGTNVSLAGHTHTANEVTLSNISGATYTNVQQMQDIFHSSGSGTGGVITDNGNGTYAVSAGTGWIRATNDATDTLLAFNWSANASITPSDGRNYVGVEYNAGTPQVVQRASYNWNYQTDFPLGEVVKEGAVLHIFNAQHKVGDHAGKMIEAMEDTMGFARDNRTGGIILGETGTRNLTVSAGSLWYGLTEYPITAKNTSVSDTFDYYYRDGVGGWTLVSAQTAWNNTQFDNNSGTLATMSSAKFGVHWFYIDIEANGQLVGIYGQAEYNTVAGANDATPPATVPDRLQSHGKIIGRLIFQKSATSATSVESVFNTIFSSSAVVNHNNLAGLQGGTTDEYYHLTSAQVSALHDAVTVADSTEIDFTLTGQQITASLVAGSIDETKLDTSVNASLDLADSAMQPGDGITDLNATAWRVFYSNGTGDVTELALGASGTFLQSNGATSAPTFAVPAGSGDVSKVGTPVNNQIGVWTGDGTLEGDTALTFDTTTDTLAIGASGKLAFGAVTILDDTTGTTTLSNIDALDATTEATIESAIDTLANLTSVQGQTLTLAGAFITSGANSLTLTTTGATNVTLPTSGTLATTAQLHDAVTVADSAEIDLTLTGQQISASIVAGSIDETKLDASVNASLDLADSALQSSDIGVSVGDVVGPASSTDNAIARFDSTTGKLLQNSGVTVSDNNAIALTIADTANEVGLIITQNDATNDPLALHVVGTTQNNLVSIQQNNAGTTGAYLDLYHNSATPSTSDNSGIEFYFNNGSASKFLGSDILVYPSNLTAGSEATDVYWSAKYAGVGANVLSFLGSSNSVIFGRSAVDVTIQSSGNADLTLQTGNASTGSITIADGANGNISLTPNGTGAVAVSTTLELGHATDTTLSRVSAGVIAVEGVTVPTISSTNTLTNKRITPRVSTETSSATPTINTDNVDAHSITALATAITSMTTNLSGTPTDFQKLTIRFKDNGTARTIAWGASFEDAGQPLPTTTVISKLLTVGFIYNSVTSKWGCVAVANET